MLHFIAGDLFFNKPKFTAIAQGVNCRGVWGGGISRPFFTRWPEMLQLYLAKCKSDIPDNLGGQCLFYDDRKISGYFVCNLFTQIDPGPDARYNLIEQCLAETKHTLDKEGIDSLGLPAIGAGIGGLQLEKVKDIVRLVFNNWAGNVYFYQEYRVNS